MIRHKMQTLFEAREAATMYEDEDQIIEDKRIFVRNLGWLLSQTRDQVTQAELVIAPDGRHLVEITYKDGYKRQVNIDHDSYAAIIRDVARRFQ